MQRIFRSLNILIKNGNYFDSKKVLNQLWKLNGHLDHVRYSSVKSPPSGGRPTCRQNFHQECEDSLNKQINMELYASYVYMSMAYYMSREDVAFPGLYKFFKKCSDDERGHAEKQMNYLNSRGGQILFGFIEKPSKNDWVSPLESINEALELEKTVNQSLLDLHGVASKNVDPNLCDFLESEFLQDQVDDIKKLSDYLTQLNRVGQGLGEFIWDKELE